MSKVIYSERTNYIPLFVATTAERVRLIDGDRYRIKTVLVDTRAEEAIQRSEQWVRDSHSGSTPHNTAIRTAIQMHDAMVVEMQVLFYDKYQETEEA